MTPVAVLARNAALIRWYRDTAIDYPWRDVGDPYAVLVSEVMLQQTQAARVAPRYERFMERFPDIEALASAPLADVLDEWSGLGYNSRAKRLRAAAQLVVKGGWPDDLTELPGVGDYTAAALGAFAFGRHVAALDTNLRRVLSRWEGRPLDGRELRERAAESIDDDASAWNQAVMDLGATVCVARSPRCAECPVERWCSGPDAYVAPRAQGRFAGSNRQARGAVVKTLLTGDGTVDAIVAATGIEHDRVRTAVAQLAAEGLVSERPDGRYGV